MSTAAPPEDAEDVFHREETSSASVTTVLLGLILFSQ
jgi:hypothetical protein